jgi:2-iminobutanoate/2-iminopropanoate deaminase
MSIELFRANTGPTISNYALRFVRTRPSVVRMPERQELRVQGLAAPISHYCDAVRFGDLLFISGVAPIDVNGRVVSDDVVMQARQVFLNMKAVLDAAGARFSDILKVTVYLLDVNDRAKINPVRREFFREARPASTLVGVAELAIPGMKVEIEAVVGLRSEG